MKLKADEKRGDRTKWGGEKKKANQTSHNNCHHSLFPFCLSHIISTSEAQ